MGGCSGILWGSVLLVLGIIYFGVLGGEVSEHPRYWLMSIGKGGVLIWLGMRAFRGGVRDSAILVVAGLAALVHDAAAHDFAIWSSSLWSRYPFKLYTVGAFAVAAASLGLAAALVRRRASNEDG